MLDQRENAAFPVRSGAPSESDRVRYVKHFYALLPALVPGTTAEFLHLKDSLVGLLQHKPFPSGESALTGVRVAPPFSGRDFSNLSLAGVSVPAWQLMCNGTTFSPEIDSPVYITALVNVMSADVLEHYSSYLNIDHRGTLSTGMAVLAAAAEFTVKHGFVAVCGFVGRHEVGLGAEQLSRLNLHPVFDNKRDVLVLIKT